MATIGEHWVKIEFKVIFVCKKATSVLPNVVKCGSGAGVMWKMMSWEIWKRRSGQILVNFSTFWGKLIDDLQKSDCYGLNSERKQSLTSSHGSLACVLLLLAVFFNPVGPFFQRKIDSPIFFPAPEESPFLTVTLTVKLDYSLWDFYFSTYWWFHQPHHCNCIGTRELWKGAFSSLLCLLKVPPEMPRTQRRGFLLLPIIPIGKKLLVLQR